MTTTTASTAIELGFNSDVRQALKAFAEAKALADKAEALKKEAEATLRQALGEATTATIGGITAFQLISRTNTYVNAKALKVDFPEAYEATQYQTAYDFIKVAR